MLGELSVGTDGDHVLWAPSFPHQALVGDVPSLSLLVTQASLSPGLSPGLGIGFRGHNPGVM